MEIPEVPIASEDSPDITHDGVLQCTKQAWLNRNGYFQSSFIIDADFNTFTNKKHQTERPVTTQLTGS